LKAIRDLDKLTGGPGTRAGPFLFPESEVIARDPTQEDPNRSVRERPIQPSSTVYRILQMIAREIAKDLEKRQGSPGESSTEE
jgi:hypothetical protein